MPQFLEQFIEKLFVLIKVLQDMVADKPVIGLISELSIEQCCMLLGGVVILLIIIIPLIIIGLTVSLPKHLRKRSVQKFFGIDDLSRFKVKKMGKAGSKYYYDEGVNTFQLVLPKWKYADSFGGKEPHKLFNKIIQGESVLWLHMRNKVYILSTEDPWEMIYLVHTLRESGIDILACKQEMEKQEQIESSKPTTDEFIQGLIARMGEDTDSFNNLCRKRLEAQGMQVMDAPKNRNGINFFAKNGHNPTLVKCQLVPYKHLDGLEELKEFREAADDLFTDNCIFITTGHITIAAAGYAREHNIEVICTEQLMNLMDESVKLDPTKAYLQWELTTRDLNSLMPEDLVSKILS